MRPTPSLSQLKRVAPLLAGLAVLALGLFSLLGAQAEEVSRLPDSAEVSKHIDRIIDARLSELGVTAAPQSDDAEFLRRVTLDVLGTVPTVAEVETFLADRAQDKRARKIDELLAHEGYAEHWATWWYTTLTGLTPGVSVREGDGGRALAGAGGESFHTWLADQFAANRPYTEWVTELLTATGRTDENGAAAYFARWDGNVNNAASAAARNFLGVRIQCAQCHDHMYEEQWKQQDFKAMAAFFALVRQEQVPEYRELQQMRREREARAKEMGEEAPDMRPGRRGESERMTPEEAKRLQMLAKARGVMDVSERPADARTGANAERLMRRVADKNPEAKERLELMSVTPKFWMGSVAADVPGIPRRMLLARWITSDSNPYFATTLTNRLWGAMMGRGIVHPVDDFNSFNPASHPEVLELLAEDFKAHRYDVKRVLRVILGTAAYQRSSRLDSEEQPDPALFAVGRVRPLTIEQLYNSLTRTTGADLALGRRSQQESRRARSLVFSAFSFVFDDDEQAEEQDFEGSIPQGLFLMNGELMRRLVDLDGRRAPLSAALAAARTDKEKVEQIYLRAYGRDPSSAELQSALAFLKRAGGDANALEDFFWAILNSAEFMTNH